MYVCICVYNVKAYTYLSIHTHLFCLFFCGCSPSGARTAGPPAFRVNQAMSLHSAFIISAETHSWLPGRQKANPARVLRQACVMILHSGGLGRQGRGRRGRGRGRGELITSFNITGYGLLLPPVSQGGGGQAGGGRGAGHR